MSTTAVCAAMPADKETVKTLGLGYFPFFLILLHVIYIFFTFWSLMSSMFSHVQHGTPVCCYNYFDYTYYGIWQQCGERVQFNRWWISISICSLEDLISEGIFIRLLAEISEYNKQQGGTLNCEVQSSYFLLRLISLAWRVLVCIQTYDSPGGLIGEVRSPERLQVPDSEQMLTNRNTNTPEGHSKCVCVFLPLGRRSMRLAGSALHWSRTCSHGHLLVYDASQKTDKPKLLFILQLPCKWSSQLSPHAINPDPQTRRQWFGFPLILLHIPFFSICLFWPLNLRFLSFCLFFYCSLSSSYRADV